MTKIIAGDETDALVATKVMGWTLDEQTRMWRGDRAADIDITIMAYPPAPQYRMCSNRYWRPSTDIRDAMAVLRWWGKSAVSSREVDGVISKVVDATGAREWSVGYACCHDAFFCEMNGYGAVLGEAYASTLEMAVCIAALKAVEFK